MEKSMVIVGAGAAGLSAGCYARMNGFQTTLFEMHDKPGGLCTSWKRGGYLFDGSVAGLAGAAPGNPLYRLWQEIGVIKYCPLFYQVNFGYIYFPDGKIITVHSDPDKLEKHLLEQFPDDKHTIKYFTDALRSIMRMDMPFNDEQGLSALYKNISTGVSMISYLPAILKYSNTTIQKLIDSTSSPQLKAVFTNLVHFGGTHVPVLTILLPLAYAHRKMAGIPVEGWLSFARAIERRFMELGGKVIYKTRVERLFAENGIARGVVLADGSVHRADIVISAVDGRFSNSAFLGKHEDSVCSLFTPERMSDQPVQVNLGVEDEMPGIDGPVTYILTQPFAAAGKDHQKITFHTKYYDKEASPQAASAVMAFLDSSYEWWADISGNKQRYLAEKQRAADEVIKAIDTYRPGFGKKVKVIDVSTPLSRERYTGNWMGAIQGFKPSTNITSAFFNNSPRYAFKGIQGLYFAGQWVEPWGGITTAVQSGRKAISIICKNEGKRFITIVP